MRARLFFFLGLAAAAACVGEDTDYVPPPPGTPDASSPSGVDGGGGGLPDVLVVGETDSGGTDSAPEGDAAVLDCDGATVCTDFEAQPLPLTIEATANGRVDLDGGVATMVVPSTEGAIVTTTIFKAVHSVECSFDMYIEVRGGAQANLVLLTINNATGYSELTITSNEASHRWSATNAESVVEAGTGIKTLPMADRAWNHVVATVNQTEASVRVGSANPVTIQAGGITGSFFKLYLGAQTYAGPSPAWKLKYDNLRCVSQ